MVIIVDIGLSVYSVYKVAGAESTFRKDYRAALRKFKREAKERPGWVYAADVSGLINEKGDWLVKPGDTVILPLPITKRAYSKFSQLTYCIVAQARKFRFDIVIVATDSIMVDRQIKYQADAWFFSETAFWKMAGTNGVKGK